MALGDEQAGTSLLLFHLELKLRARDDPQSQFSFAIFGSQVSFSLWYRNIKSRQALTSLKNVKLGGKKWKTAGLISG